jgi:DNA-binding CsgD family transcriptional regulator
MIEHGRAGQETHILVKLNVENRTAAAAIAVAALASAKE